MRHLVLGLCALTVSTTGAFAQTYLPPQDYFGPTTIVNMDALQGGNGVNHGVTPMAAPVLSMPLPPPLPAAEYIPAPMHMSAPSPMPMPITPHGVASALPAGDLVDPPVSRIPVMADVQELPPAMPPVAAAHPDVLVPAPIMADVPVVHSSVAATKTVSVNGSDRLLPPAQLSQKDVFITPSLADTQRGVASSPAAKAIVQEKPYQVAAIQPQAVQPYVAPVAAVDMAPIVPNPVMPPADQLVPAGISASKGNAEFDAYRLTFDGGSSVLKPADKAVLDTIIAKMKTDPALRLRMQAYAAGTPETSGQARRLSLARAMNIRAYMTDKGVVATRLDVRALGMGSAELQDNVAGSKAPADRVDVVFMRG